MLQFAERSSPSPVRAPGSSPPAAGRRPEAAAARHHPRADRPRLGAEGDPRGRPAPDDRVLPEEAGSLAGGGLRAGPRGLLAGLVHVLGRRDDDDGECRDEEPPQVGPAVTRRVGGENCRGREQDQPGRALPRRDGGKERGPTVRWTMATATTSIPSRKSSVTVSEAGTVQRTIVPTSAARRPRRRGACRPSARASARAA